MKMECFKKIVCKLKRDAEICVTFYRDNENHREIRMQNANVTQPILMSLSLNLVPHLPHLVYSYVSGVNFANDLHIFRYKATLSGLRSASTEQEIDQSIPQIVSSILSQFGTVSFECLSLDKKKDRIESLKKLVYGAYNLSENMLELEFEYPSLQELYADYSPNDATVVRTFFDLEPISPEPNTQNSFPALLFELHTGILFTITYKQLNSEQWEIVLHNYKAAALVEETKYAIPLSICNNIRALSETAVVWGHYQLPCHAWVIRYFDSSHVNAAHIRSIIFKSIRKYGTLVAAGNNVDTYRMSAEKSKYVQQIDPRYENSTTAKTKDGPTFFKIKAPKCRTPFNIVFVDMSDEEINTTCKHLVAMHEYYRALHHDRVFGKRVGKLICEFNTLCSTDDDAPKRYTDILQADVVICKNASPNDLWVREYAILHKIPVQYMSRITNRAAFDEVLDLFDKENDNKEEENNV